MSTLPDREREMVALTADFVDRREIPAKIPTLGYRGVEACELTFDAMRVPAGVVLGG